MPKRRSNYQSKKTLPNEPVTPLTRLRVSTHSTILASRPPVAEGAPWRSWCITLSTPGSGSGSLSGSSSGSGDSTLPGVKEVRYRLHGTFDDPVRRLTEGPWDIEEVGWGGFDIPITLVWEEAGRAEWSFVHRLSFDESQYVIELDVPKRIGYDMGDDEEDTPEEEGVGGEDVEGREGSADPALQRTTAVWDLIVVTRNRVIPDRTPVDPTTPWRRWRIEVLARNRTTHQMTARIPGAAEVSCILHPSLRGGPRRRWESPPYVIEEEGWGGFWIPFRVVWETQPNGTCVEDWRFQHNLSFDTPSSVAILPLPPGISVPANWEMSSPWGDMEEGIPQELEWAAGHARLARMISRLPAHRQGELVEFIRSERSSDSVYLQEVGVGAEAVQLDVGTMKRRLRAAVERKVAGWAGEMGGDVWGWEGHEECVMPWDELS